MIACSGIALALACGDLGPRAQGLRSLWLPEGQYKGSTTTSNH